MYSKVGEVAVLFLEAPCPLINGLLEERRGSKFNQIGKHQRKSIGEFTG